jgi:hypothetical protein
VLSNCSFTGGAVALSVAARACAHLATVSVTSAGVGVSVTGAKAVATGLEAVQCSAAAIAVFDSGSVAIDGARIRDCTGLAVQAHSRGSARLANASVSAHSGAAVVLAIDGGVAQLEKCTLGAGARIHADARGGGIVHFEGCDLAVAGVQASEGGTVQFAGGRVCGAEVAVMIGDGGVCRANGAEIAECTGGAVWAGKGAVAEFRKCVFDGKGQVALQVQGAAVSITGCTIAGHLYGVFVDPAAKFNESETRFERIGKKDIYRSQ